MKDKRWNQIEAIFQAALDLDVKDRDLFLNEKCGQDTALKSEVEKLLDNHLSAGSFIESPVWADGHVDGQGELLSDTFVDLFAGNEPSALIGKRIGVFELTKEIGRGGMGSVFLAERADGEFRQKVAVKLIRRGMDSDFIIRRFRHERQILASFDHPFISRLIDGGRTAEGLPYFVMEYVEGDSLYEYADLKRLSLKCRIELFREVCSAVSYAHDKQIIHRDIKPGNILVTGDGIPKLLDFGIAKILDSDLIHESHSPTSSFMRLMTPDFASPEQMSGREITAASDIYSLGVLLYELLSGHNPHNFTDLPLHEISRIACEEIPRLPSRIFADEENLLKKYGSDPTLFASACSSNSVEIRGALTGDLDTIVMKALAKKPALRYQTVKELSDDLKRYLSNKPAHAREFVRRDAGLFASRATGKSPARSLAVLPFKYHNLGSVQDSNEDFLGIGLADALITRLSKIRSFNVRPASSLLSLESAEIDPVSAGQVLDVEFVIEGTIKRVEERLRVTVQLLDVAANSAIWAVSIDETISDIFTLEDSIAARVVEGVLPQISGGELKDYSDRGTESPAAFEHCLRGRYFFNSGIEEGLAKAFVCFHEAITADPGYALAYVGLADYYTFLGIYGVLPPKECFSAAIDAGSKAVELDENSAQAHASLGFAVHAGHYDWSKAEYHLGRALELNPGYAAAHTYFGIVRFTQGRFAEGLDFSDRSIELDPLNPFNHHIKGWGLIFARRYEESVSHYQKIVAQFPKYGLSYYGLSRALACLGRNEEALESIRTSRSLLGENILVMSTEAEVLAAIGKGDECAAKLANLMQLKESRYVSPYHLATIYCRLNDGEQALDSLEYALEINEAWLNWLGVEPVFDIIRDDQRYTNMLDAIGYRFFFNDLSGHDSDPNAFYNTADRNTSETMLLENRFSDPEMKTDTVPNPVRQWKRTGVFAAFVLLMFTGIGSFLYFGSGLGQPESAVLTDSLNPNSIVILPFTSDDPMDENLGIGLADALSGRLGYIKRLSVISPNSGRIIAKENTGKTQFDVPSRYLVRGKIARRGEKYVSVEAELVRTSDNRPLWSESFPSNDENFFSIQKAIAEKILTSLNTKPSPTEQLHLSRAYTKNNAAYQLYLVGRFLMSNRSPENIRKAIKSFDEAAHEDSDFALAYAGLADAYTLLKLYEMPTPSDAFPKAKYFAQKALEIDDDLAEAHTSLAYIKFYEERDRQGAELGFRRAVQINPSYSQAHHWFAIVLMAMNRPMEAVEEMRTAEQLDPRSKIVRTALGMMYVYNKRYDEALIECNDVLAGDAGFVPALKVKRWIYQSKGDYAAARDAFRKERSYSGGDTSHPGWYVIEAQVEAMNSNKSEVVAKLDKAIADKQVSGFPSTYSYEIALAYNALGDSRRALAWLEKGDRAGDNGISMLGVDPRFENIRSDPKFLTLQKRVVATPGRK